MNDYLKQGSGIAKQGTEAASQEPLWRRFRLHCTSKKLLHEPEILSRERVHNLVFSILWQYIARGPEKNLESSFSAFLLERLSGCGLLSCTAIPPKRTIDLNQVICRIYRHESATAIVLQQLYASLERLQEQNEVSRLFCDILTTAMPEARWQYLLLLYALIIPNAPAGLFGLGDVSSIVHKLYPQATDGETHDLLQRYRESGLVWHLLSTSCCCFCVRFLPSL